MGARNDHISQGHAVLLTTEHFVENLMWTRCWGCGEKYDGAPANGERVVKRSEQSMRPDIIKACVLNRVRLLATAWTVAARLLCLWNFPGKNTRLGCCSLLQGIFPTQGSTPRLLCLLHWQTDSLPAEPLGKPDVIKARVNEVCIEWITFRRSEVRLPRRGGI